MSSSQAKVLFEASFCFLVILCVGGSLIRMTTGFEKEGESNDFIKNPPTLLDCDPVEYPVEDVVFFKSDDIFLIPENITVNSAQYRIEGGKILVCMPHQHVSGEEAALNCTDKFLYESDEFQILPNGSVLLHEVILTPGEYELKGDELEACALDSGDYTDSDYVSPETRMGEISICIGKVGSWISIIALIGHLGIFCFLPTLRNLPGYNLASLGVAFLLSYSFVLIGQIPEVLGLSCVISAVLQQNFFLTAFCCMNVLAFDVWRTLKLATEKFAVGSQNTRKRQFIWYSVYAWGCPLVISSISVIVDNLEGFPDKIKPFYGRHDICFLTNHFAKIIFFVAPAFTLCIINGVFFVRSSCIVSINTMKCTSDQSKQNVHFNYILYLRLGIMMGLTWLMGVIALISGNRIVWLVSDVLNSLQGLFLFLLFTCTKKVLKLLRERTGANPSVSDKQTTLSSNSSNITTKV